jgi:hypothetical protein
MMDGFRASRIGLFESWDLGSIGERIGVKTNLFFENAARTCN